MSAEGKGMNWDVVFPGSPGSQISFEDWAKKLARWSVTGSQQVKLVLQQAGELVRREAQASHLSGPKMPRGVGDSTGGTLAVQTGTLRRSITIRVSVSPGDITAEVGTSIPYGRVHELGLKMPERPFLRPSLNKEHGQIFNMIRDAWFKAYGK